MRIEVTPNYELELLHHTDVHRPVSRVKTISPFVGGGGGRCEVSKQHIFGCLMVKAFLKHGLKQQSGRGVNLCSFKPPVLG